MAYSYSAAPIYLDPWNENAFEGTARLIAPVPNQADVTLNGKTCRRYWVRFLWTTINLDRWVNLANVYSVAPYEQFNLSLSPNTAGYTLDLAGLRMLFSTTSAAGTAFSTYLQTPGLAPGRVIVGYGLHVGSWAGFSPSTQIKYQVVYYSSSNPNSSLNGLASTTYTQTSSNRTRYETILGSTLTVDEDYNYAVRIFGTLYAVVEGTTQTLAAFNPFLLLEPVS